MNKLKSQSTEPVKLSAQTRLIIALKFQFQTSAYCFRRIIVYLFITPLYRVIQKSVYQAKEYGILYNSAEYIGVFI